MSYQCEIKDQPAQPVLAIRTHTSVQNLPQETGRAFGSIMQYMGMQGEQPVGAPYVAYFNMDMQDLDVEIGFPVARRLAGQGEVQPSEIPGGKYATCLYVGPYADCGPAYEGLTAFVKERGCEATGVAYEHYFNNPQTTPPAELQTLIMFPLKS